jgi:hypothetical protein
VKFVGVRPLNARTQSGFLTHAGSRPDVELLSTGRDVLTPHVRAVARVSDGLINLAAAHRAATLRTSFSATSFTNSVCQSGGNQRILSGAVAERTCAFSTVVLSVEELYHRDEPFCQGSRELIELAAAQASSTLVRGYN